MTTEGRTAPPNEDRRFEPSRSLPSYGPAGSLLGPPTSYFSAVTFYSQRQPLVEEDRHTALVLGFLRPAPVAGALEPWLGVVLGREVRAKPMDHLARPGAAE